MNSVSASATRQSRCANLFCMGWMINACCSGGGGGGCGAENILGGLAMAQCAEFTLKKTIKKAIFRLKNMQEYSGVEAAVERNKIFVVGGESKSTFYT